MAGEQMELDGGYRRLLFDSRSPWVFHAAGFTIPLDSLLVNHQIVHVGPELYWWFQTLCRELALKTIRPAWSSGAACVILASLTTCTSTPFTVVMVEHNMNDRQ